MAGNKGLQIHTVSLRNDDDNSVLTQIAKEANGQFKVLPRSDLDVYASEAGHSRPRGPRARRCCIAAIIP